MTLTPSNDTSPDDYDGDFRAYVDIPLLVDGTNADTADETFTVTIEGATPVDGKLVTIADNSATVTIGNPDRNAIYFFPNRPLVDGDQASFQCFIPVPLPMQSFIDTATLVSFGESGAATVTNINDDLLAGVNTTPYTASANSSDATDPLVLLLSTSESRPGVRLGFRADNGYDRNRETETFSFSCHGLRPGGVTSDALISGSFCDVNFGQAYATTEPCL